jgi:hypothetical protein
MNEYAILKTHENGEFENEVYLMEQEMGLPVAYMGLEDVAQKMLMYYIEPNVLEPNSREETQGNILASFMMAYPNKKIFEDLFITERQESGVDGSGNSVFEWVTYKNPEKANTLLRIRQMAGAYFRKNRLKELVKPMKDIMLQGGFKDEEILEQEIMNDALAKDKSNYTARMRSLAVKVKGMEKKNSLQQINVYVEGGGKELNRTIIEASGNDSYDLGIDYD